MLVDKLIKECDDLTEKADIADSEKEFRILEDLLAKVSCQKNLKLPHCH